MADGRAKVYADPEGPGESLTKQAPAAETDINVIFRKYEQTGQLPVFREGGRYGDFSSGADYFEQVLRVKAAEDAFLALPAHVRDYCENDPAKLLELVHDPSPAAVAKCAELGLVPQPELKAEPEAPQEGGETA